MQGVPNLLALLQHWSFHPRYLATQLEAGTETRRESTATSSAPSDDAHWIHLEKEESCPLEAETLDFLSGNLWIRKLRTPQLARYAYTAPWARVLSHPRGRVPFPAWFSSVTRIKSDSTSPKKGFAWTSFLSAIEGLVFSSFRQGLSEIVQ